MPSWIRRKLKERKLGQILKAYGGYIQPSEISNLNLKLDLYPSMHADVISTDHLTVAYDSNKMQVPIQEGVLVSNSKKTELSSGTVCAKGQFRVEVEYNALSAKHLIEETETSVIEKALGIKHRENNSRIISSPLYVMSTDFFLKKVAEYVKPVAISNRDTGSHITTTNIWPYIFDEYLKDNKLLYKLKRSSYVEIRGTWFADRYKLTQNEIEMLKVLSMVTSKKPSITILRTDRPLKSGESNDLPYFSIAEPSVVDPDRAPITISNRSNTKISFVRNHDDGKWSFEENLEDGVLYLYPERDFILPRIPIPVEISQPGLDTIVPPANSAKRYVARPYHPLRSEPEVYSTMDNKDEGYPGKVSFIKIKGVDSYEVIVDRHFNNSGYFRNLGREFLATTKDTIPMILLTDWPLDFSLGLYAFSTITQGRWGQALNDFVSYMRPLFDISNCNFWFLLWNYAAIGFWSYCVLDVMRNHKNLVRPLFADKKLTKQGNGLMELEVGCNEILPTIKDMLPRLKDFKKPSDSDESTESNEPSTEDWAKDKRVKKKLG